MFILVFPYQEYIVRKAGQEVSQSGVWRLCEGGGGGGSHISGAMGNLVYTEPGCVYIGLSLSRIYCEKGRTGSIPVRLGGGGGELSHLRDYEEPSVHGARLCLYWFFLIDSVIVRKAGWEVSQSGMWRLCEGWAELSYLMDYGEPSVHSVVWCLGEMSKFNFFGPRFPHSLTKSLCLSMVNFVATPVFNV